MTEVRAIADALGARAEEVCRRLLPKGRRSGRYWTVGGVDGAPGRSMWVRLQPPGRPGAWTDAATGERGDLLDLIALRLGARSLAPALDEARAILSLRAPAPAVHRGAPVSSAARTAAATRVWRASRPLAGTHAEAYLRARGLEPGARGSLRFHPALSHHDDTRVRPLPALVGAVTTDAGALSAIHRTWLDPERPAKARVRSPRKALGPVHGHAVRFEGAPAHPPLLVVGEGLETVLAVLTALPTLPGAAALSAPGLAAFVPPPALERLLIARDNDPAGERAARRLARRCRESGLAATLLVPELGDFADDLAAFGPSALARRLQPYLEPTAPPVAPRDGQPRNTRNQPMSGSPDTRHDTATYTRYRDGDWAVRVPAEVHPLEIGEVARLDVHRRSGPVHCETVRCVWRGLSHRSGQRIAICEILPDTPDTK